MKLKRKYHYVDEEIYAVVKSKENPEKFDIAGSVITTHLASQKLEAISVTLIPVGNIRIDKSVKDRKPCPEHCIVSTTKEGLRLEVYIENCEVCIDCADKDDATLRSVINLSEKDKVCDC